MRHSLTIKKAARPTARMVIELNRKRNRAADQHADEQRGSEMVSIDGHGVVDRFAQTVRFRRRRPNRPKR